MLHLDAAVVDVELPLHRMTDLLEQGGERVREDRSPGMAGVQGAGGIRRDELHVDLGVGADVEPGVVVNALVDHRDENVVEPGVGEVEVHESRTGDLDTLHVRRGRRVQVVGELGGQLSGVSCRPPSPTAAQRLVDQSPCSRRAGRSSEICAGGSCPSTPSAAAMAAVSWSTIMNARVYGCGGPATGEYPRPVAPTSAVAPAPTVAVATAINADVPPGEPGEFAPVAIGPISVWPPVVLAPMAGVTDVPFRTLCRRFGAGLYVNQMITARGLVEDHVKTKKLRRVRSGRVAPIHPALLHRSALSGPRRAQADR